MKPVALRSTRLVLDQPVLADVPLIAEYCADPVFESFMTLPWPYEHKHAEFFLEKIVQPGWELEREFTWALRTHSGGPLLGVIGARVASHDFGFWIGSPHRGKGYMTEAVGRMIDWLFDRGWQNVNWECVVGNAASATVARRNGFTYTGVRPTDLEFRDGSHPDAWHGTLAATDDRNEKPGWPA